MVMSLNPSKQCFNCKTVVLKPEISLGTFLQHFTSILNKKNFNILTFQKSEIRTIPRFCLKTITQRVRPHCLSFLNRKPGRLTSFFGETIGAPRKNNTVVFVADSKKTATQKTRFSHLTEISGFDF